MSTSLASISSCIVKDRYFFNNLKYPHLLLMLTIFVYSNDIINWLYINHFLYYAQ
jgi:hypothetical protein